MSACPEAPPGQSSSPRQHCLRCLRPQSAHHDACICRWIRPVRVQTAVVVLQHPLEAQHPKGSARLLHLSLPGSCLLTGEVFDDAVLRSALNRYPDAEGKPRQAVLLYPVEPDNQVQAALQPPATADSIASPLFDPARTCLVVLDGTWRKSRKMLHANGWLQRLPRLSLQAAAPSRYSAVRKARRPDQLSTLEATCAALAQLEGAPETFDALLAAFDGFVAQQQQQQQPTTVLRHQRLSRAT